jgi:hypothetical protein
MPKTPVASEAVRDEWLRRVQAEYTSAAITQNFTLWLMQIAASPDLIRSGLRIAWDEMVHARMSHKTYVAAGGDRAPELVREKLLLRRDEAEPIEYAVMRVTLDTFCIGETVAVPLFKNLRESCTQPVARRALDRILRDEVRHRGPHETVLRAVVAQALPRYFAKVQRSYGGSLKHLASMPAEDRAWGLMPPADYAGIVERTLARDWIPRFAAVGIDAATAWEQSRQLARTG